MAKLPAFDQWTAPWEKNGTEFDADAAKKFIYDLHKDVETKTDEIKIEKGKARDAETAKSELQTQLDAKISGEQGEAAELSRKLAAAEKKIADRAAADAARAGKALLVALDIEGITAAQAKALAPLMSGDDDDALKESAEAVITKLGVKIGTAVEKEEPEGDNDSIRRRGLPLAGTKGDPNPTGGRELPSVITPEGLNALVPL